MYEMTDQEFEGAIEEAIERIPERFLAALEDVAIVMRDEPAELIGLDGFDTLGDRGGAGGFNKGQASELLGLYDGIPLTARNDVHDVEVPDVITIFKGPHERSFTTREQIVDEIIKTVIHEIGHYFGLDDARLHEMGY